MPDDRSEYLIDMHPDEVAKIPDDEICHSARDGDCSWDKCPQERDGEPGRTGRSCPLWWIGR